MQACAVVFCVSNWLQGTHRGVVWVCRSHGCCCLCCQVIKLAGRDSLVHPHGDLLSDKNLCARQQKSRYGTQERRKAMLLPAKKDSKWQQLLKHAPGHKNLD